MPDFIKKTLLVVGIVFLFLCCAKTALAQNISVDFGQGEGLTDRAIQIIILITVLSLAPSILVMVTSFTRLVVVFSLLRSAIGLQTAPPNSVMVALALFMTGFIMAPTLERAYNEGVLPLTEGSMALPQAFEKTVSPFREFMLEEVRKEDLGLFFDLSKTEIPADVTKTPLHILIPAFMISELRRAFEIGFLLYLPFLIIDLVVASVLMSMGMMMLPPVIVSLPFKLIFFVLVDGWHLIAGSLVQSFGGG